MVTEAKKPPMRLTNAELAARIAWAKDNKKEEFLSICEELQRRRKGDEKELHSRVVDVAGKDIAKLEKRIAVLVTDRDTLQHKLRAIEREREEAETPEPKPKTKAKK
jgi:rubrerythrin